MSRVNETTFEDAFDKEHKGVVDVGMELRRRFNEQTSALTYSSSSSVELPFRSSRTEALTCKRQAFRCYHLPSVVQICLVADNDEGKGVVGGGVLVGGIGLAEFDLADLMNERMQLF